MNPRGHGTEAGYRRHRKADEQACGGCLWAHRQYNVKQQHNAASRHPKPVVVLHGSPQALELHTRSNRPVCEPCLTAACDWERAEAARYLRRLRWAS